ncbi:MBL fold metallo-hydrolase [Nitriliruptoraceae bacterium ZYF776]|nr:MBL fold metallo-hydrolase [Profundirhabdus halotolerans]
MTDTRRARRGAVVALLAVTLVALPTGGASAARGDDVPLDAWTPLPAADEVVVSEEARALREDLLGPDALDPGLVTLTWTGVSSFVVTIGGHLLLFDAWEIVGIHAGYLPIGREELAGLEPEAVLVGHGHFDHAADVGHVAGRTGATVVGSQEICDRARADARYDGLDDTFPCAITGTATTPPPGTTQELALFADLPPITVLQHVHSAVNPPGGGNRLDPFLPIFDPLPYLQLNLDPAELARFLRSLDAPQGGTWLYHLAVGDLTVLLGDSAGPLFDAPEVAEALRHGFPGCVDVMSNAILGFGQLVSGLQDPGAYVEAVGPHVFLPTHGDAWMPVISAGQARYAGRLHAELATLEHPPEIDLLLDPQDYLVPRRYEVDDPRWATPPPGSSCAEAADDADRGEAAPDPAPVATRDEPPSPEVNGREDADDAATPTTSPRPPLPVTGGGLVGLGVGALVVGGGLRRRLDGPR